MAAKYANVSSVPLSLAVFLATDNYDHNPDPNTISATALLKPVRQIVLASRVPAGDGIVDLVALLQSRMGNAIHDAIEKAWLTNHAAAMRDLGIPQAVIDRVRINPSVSEVAMAKRFGEEIIPVYLEQRASKKVGAWTVTGKFDFVGDGQLEDFKSTSVITAIKGNKNEDYIWQGSLYRWLNPTIITSDQLKIQWVFTDWSKAQALADPAYPQSRTLQKVFHLKSVQETQAFVERKLALIERYWDAPEDDIPECDDAELWRDEPVFKYYRSGAVSARSTKNFETYQEAMQRFVEDGSTGLVKEVKGKAKACRYCAAFAACTQKDRLMAADDLSV